MDLQPYSHYCFSKISRTLFDFLNNTIWVSLFQRNSSLIFWTGVSCFSVTLFYFTLFCCGRKANLVLFTLFYSTLLTLTDRQKDGQKNKYTRFAGAGGTCPRFAWAGGTFFPAYSCGVVLVILVLVGNSFWCYVRTQCTIQMYRKKGLIVCLAGARSLLRPEKKVLVVCLAGARLGPIYAKSFFFYAKLNGSNLNKTNLYQFQLELI